MSQLVHGGARLIGAAYQPTKHDEDALNEADAELLKLRKIEEAAEHEAHRKLHL